MKMFNLKSCPFSLNRHGGYIGQIFAGTLVRLFWLFVFGFGIKIGSCLKCHILGGIHSCQRGKIC